MPPHITDTMTPERPSQSLDEHDSHHPGLTTLVPPVTGAAFWATKILTTGAGEVTSDYMGGSPLAVLLAGLAGLLLIASLVAQFRATAYHPTRYWLAALMVSVFGTSVADIVHVVLGVSYTASTITLLAILLGILRTWHRSEGTLSIHSVTTRRRQSFYWATVMCTFAFGTAAGDMFANQFNLGYFVPGLLFTGLILLPWAGVRLGMHGVAMFWSAYILTRPLGASFSDWAAVSRLHGGLGLGSGPVALVLLALIAVVLLAGELGGRRRTVAALWGESRAVRDIAEECDITPQAR